MEAWLDRLRREIEESTQGMDDADWLRAPQGKWNSAQILQHLGRTYGSTAKMLELNLGASRPPELRRIKPVERLTQFLVVTLGKFPSGGTAPEFAAPKGSEAGPVELQKALGGLERMTAALAAAEQRWGRRVPVGLHFALGPMSAPQWCKFHYVHGHHHLLQVRERARR